MTVRSEPTNPREAAREWIAETLRSHLHPTLHPIGGEDRIKEVAALVEAESFREGWPIETVVELAIEWAEVRNRTAGVWDAIHSSAAFDLLFRSLCGPEISSESTQTECPWCHRYTRTGRH